MPRLQHLRSCLFETMLETTRAKPVTFSKHVQEPFLHSWRQMCFSKDSSFFNSCTVSICMGLFFFLIMEKSAGMTLRAHDLVILWNPNAHKSPAPVHQLHNFTSWFHLSGKYQPTSYVRKSFAL